MKNSIILSLLASGLLLAQGCSKTTAGGAILEDDSASGAVASAIGGALSSSNSSGTVAMKKAAPFLNQSITNAVSNLVPSAFATNACPTFATTGASCTASTSNQWLSYSACSFGNSSATWSGTQLLKMSSGTAACGTFPNPGASGTLLRQFVAGASSSTPATATRTSAAGKVVTIDDASVNLSNFDGQTISTVANGGYGTQVSFDGAGKRSSVTIARRVSVVGGYDHSITGSLNVNEGATTSRTLSGSVRVFHNILKVIGTSTFSSVTHSDSCCVPVSGSITTAFTAGVNPSATPTRIGSLVVGKSETMTFTGCGTATVSAADGTSSNVTLGSCL